MQIAQRNDGYIEKMGHNNMQNDSFLGAAFTSLFKTTIINMK